MDGADIFDLSTGELLQELSSIDHQPESESLRWRQQLILQELQERQGYEALANQLDPGAPVHATKTDPLRELNPAPETPLQSPRNAQEPESDSQDAPSQERKSGLDFGGVCEKESWKQARRTSRDVTTAPPVVVQKGTFSEGSKTARASVLTEIVIGASPVMPSPRRRSSHRRKSGGLEAEPTRKALPERDKEAVAKENVERRKEYARAVVLKAAVERAREKAGPRLPVKLVEKLGLKGKAAELPGIDGKLPVEVVGSRDSNGEAVNCTMPETGNCEVDDSSGDGLTADSQTETVQRELLQGVPECLSGNNVLTHRRGDSVVVETPADALAEESPFEEDRSSNMLVAGVESMSQNSCEPDSDDRGIEREPAMVEICAGSSKEQTAQEMLEETAHVEDAESENGVIETEVGRLGSGIDTAFEDSQSVGLEGPTAVHEVSTQAGYFIQDESLQGSPRKSKECESVADQGQRNLDLGATQQDTSRVLKLTTVSSDGETTVRLSSVEVEPETQSAVVAPTQRCPVSQVNGKPGLSTSTAAEAQFPAPAATQLSVSQTGSKPSPLTRLEQIFTRYASGPVASKEVGARPGPALQQFFKDVAQSLDADALLMKAPEERTLGMAGMRTSDRLLLRVEVADLLTSFAAASKNWTVDIASQSAYWNVLWTWCARPRVDYSELLVWQKVNHFPHSKQLTRKDLLKGHLARFSRAANALMPTTFTLPREYVAFVRAFSEGRTDVTDPSEKASKPGPDGSRPEAVSENGPKTDAECSNLWIMKPVGKSRGQGIFLVSDIAHVAYGEAMIVQKYVERPLLLHGHKFDLRLYALVTSFNPLEAFLYQEGFARFASRPYTRLESSLTDLLVHLTNTEVQKGRDHVPSFLLSQPGVDTCPSQLSSSDSLEETSIKGTKRHTVDVCGSLVYCLEDCEKGKSSGQEQGCGMHSSSIEEDLSDTFNHPSTFNLDRSGLDQRTEGSSNASEQDCKQHASNTCHSFRHEAQTADVSNAKPATESNEGYRNLDGGCKVSLARAFAFMTAHGVNVDQLWRRITALVLQSLEAVQGAIPANRNCFELFGYDVLVDEDERPWLVEVNSSPSMETGTPLDCALKGALVRDTLLLVEPFPVDRDCLASILRRRANPQPSAKSLGARLEQGARANPDLYADIAKVLNGRRQQRFGEIPAYMGHYQRIAPSNVQRKLTRKNGVA